MAESIKNQVNGRLARSAAVPDNQARLPLEEGMHLHDPDQQNERNKSLLNRRLI